jgi:S1-C subfamily serine protease
MARVQLDQQQAVGDMPSVCMRCGAPAAATKPRMFSWHPQWVTWLLLIGLLIPLLFPLTLMGLIALGTTGKRMRVCVPLCTAHRNHWRSRLLFNGIGLVLLLVTAVVLLLLFSLEAWVGPAAILPGPVPRLAAYLTAAALVALMCWLVAMAILQKNTIQAAEITDDTITLIKISPRFVDALAPTLDDAEGESPTEDGPRRPPPPRVHRDQEVKTGYRIPVYILGGLAGALLTLVGLLAGVEMLAVGLRPPQQAQPVMLTEEPPEVRARRQARQGPFADWLDDISTATTKATADNKDILMLFDGSDWQPMSTRLADEVIAKPEFRQRFDPGFILVYLDCPQGGVSPRLAGWLRYYAVPSVPMFVLADAKARPYAFEGYSGGEADNYMRQLLKLQERRVRRDQLLADVERAEGAAKLKRAKAVVDFLKEHKLARYYTPLAQEWEQLAQTYDPKNDQGLQEVFFEITWATQLAEIDRNRQDEQANLVAQLAEWKKSHRFKDADRAAQLHLYAAGLLQHTGKHQAALKYVREGLAYKPSRPEVQQQLARMESALSYASSGTGFVVAPGGYLLTNKHVVAGPGKLVVRMPGIAEPVSAELIKEDPEVDIALIRVPLAPGSRLSPLVVASDRPVHRGEEVAVLGYPMHEMVGSGIKLTKGVVSALPEAGTNHMLVLDAKVNPGNSGGPLCDSSGNVVGMVTAKSFGFGNIESYGMALPASELIAFLRQNVKGYQPSSGVEKPLPWKELDRRVSPSVVMVLKTR